MKFTSEDLMKVMGLQVGDRIKVKGYSEIFEVMKSHDGYLRIVGTNTSLADIDWLLNEDYEILPRPKRVGDLTCNYFKDCDNCPLRILFCDSRTNNKDTLYDILNRWNNEYVNFDQEIYDLLKVRLDKEVVE